ncbi:hypothetical protein [Haliangium ochraceum]|uniref:Glycosyltransferase RgtA/B/C/D-like domain-containing protein n=1 Tax=Haliangium ochraceum (strain DSM 14365 / JCM 11303 / SMP-2) TaxID=502025 RepID=D0LKJ4_HALO1|nr:hypothetical protein [Haliangium ochraceum]ACY15042.1 hypothetical protein Hoch_2506 [Haliangium ochraceum DSM 14365]
MTASASGDRAQAWGARAAALACALLAVPGLVQLALMAYAVLLRLGHPYDLEWMEGGMLAHAARLAEGHSIYPAPSIEFIPYLYTPLYPALLAVLGSIFGLSYALGRTLSLLALVALCALAVAVVRRAGRDADSADDGGAAGGALGAAASRPGAAAAVGLLAATYPWLEGWHDIVRADSVFLAMIVAGLVWLERAAALPGRRGQLEVAGAAALLALSFFCKQTGVLYVACGGALLLCWQWRRVPVYVLVAGVIGLGGTGLLSALTGGWFWTYVYEVHQAHDFNIDRFYSSFGYILGQFPAMTATIALALVAVAIGALRRRALPPGSRALLVWSFVFAVSCVVGALGWGTQWAHFNAYLPAMMSGAIAAGAALPALAGCARILAGTGTSAQTRTDGPNRLAQGAMWLAALALAAQLVAARWDPRPFVPTDADVAAGDALIAELRALRADGEIYVPFHPWYARLAGQDAIYSHRMGIMDMRYGNGWQVAGLREAFREHRFAAVVFDNRAPGWEFPTLARHYRPDRRLPASMRPRLYTGAKVVPETVWRPIDTAPPPGARVLFDFEDGRLHDWQHEGSSFGRRAVRKPVAGQGLVAGFRGRYFVTSMHRGDASTGTIASPPFRIEGKRLSFRLSGGSDPGLRVELHLLPEPTLGPDPEPESEPDSEPRSERQPRRARKREREPPVRGEIVRTARPEHDSEVMSEVSWDVSDLRGRRARLVLVDQATGSWGHLNVDDFLLWPE